MPIFDDDELMAAVWADPECPVELHGTDPTDDSATPIPWPRDRIEIPADQRGGAVYYHLCRRHGQDHPDAECLMLIVVAMGWRNWIVDRPGKPSFIRVYLGQCQDCGRIYWATVDGRE